MRQSGYFLRTIKEAPKDEVSLNAQLLIRGGFIDKLMAGTYSLLPLGLRVYRRIENIIREEMDAIGGNELFLPSMHPKENWEKTGRWGSFDALIYVGLDEEKNLALGPTHEEIISPLARRIISSYKDLPQYVYQFQNKFRKEKRAKSGLMRMREFIMKDLYSFHHNQEELDAYYEAVRKAYERIFERCGIGGETYLTYASGGAFSRYSHEFQTLTEAGEDMIYICDKCRVAINREIISDLEYKCPECGSSELREDKAVETGNIFKLGTRFSEPFELNFQDKDGEKKSVIMGCYGIGLQRLMGVIAEIKNDQRGIIWPLEVSPFRVHLVSLGVKNEEVSRKTDDVYADLIKAGVEVLYDDRVDATVGEKFADSDLIGIPYRVVVSDKTLKENKAEVKRRGSEQAELVSWHELTNMIISL